MNDPKHFHPTDSASSEPAFESEAFHGANSEPQIDCLIAFGANLGDAGLTYRSVEQALGRVDGFSHVKPSALITTRPIGGPADQNVYQNGALLLKTSLNAADSHQALVKIEREQGRIKRERWGSRNVDLDLLLFGDQIVDEPNLTVPHPRMSFRRFVLEPASEIAREMLHPICGLTVGQLLDRINGAERTIEWLVDREGNGQRQANQDDEHWHDFREAMVNRFPELEFRFRDSHSTLDKSGLLVIVEDESVLPWVRSPYLNLARSSLENAEREVAAAIAALEPL